MEPDQTIATLPRQFLRPLMCLALTSGRSYGYQLSERVVELGLQPIDTAAIYRMLRSMEHDGLVDSEWESSETGPRRRVYELTDDGHRAATRHAGELAALRDRLDEAIATTVAHRR